MMMEKSAGAVVFREEKGKRKYLLLHYQNVTSYWGFPKGNVEQGESDEQAALREIMEETGITDTKIISGFARAVDYHYKRDNSLISKKAAYFLAVTQQKDIKISTEHIGYVWADFGKALKILTHQNTRDVLKDAEKFLLTQQSRHSLSA